jgi:hypothetical protein
LFLLDVEGPAPVEEEEEARREGSKRASGPFSRMMVALLWEWA